MGNKQEANIGLDITLIRKWNLTVDFYNEATSDMLFELPISKVTGLDKVYQKYRFYAQQRCGNRLKRYYLTDKGMEPGPLMPMLHSTKTVLQNCQTENLLKILILSYRKDILSDNSIW